MICLHILNWKIDSVELAALIFVNKNNILNVIGDYLCLSQLILDSLVCSEGK